MKSKSTHKYLVSSGKNQMRKIAVNTVGSQIVLAGYLSVFLLAKAVS